MQSTSSTPQSLVGKAPRLTWRKPYRFREIPKSKPMRRDPKSKLPRTRETKTLKLKKAVSHKTNPFIPLENGADSDNLSPRCPRLIDHQHTNALMPGLAPRFSAMNYTSSPGRGGTSGEATKSFL